MAPSYIPQFNLPYKDIILIRISFPRIYTLNREVRSYILGFGIKIPLYHPTNSDKGCTCPLFPRKRPRTRWRPFCRERAETRRVRGAMLATRPDFFVSIKNRRAHFCQSGHVFRKWVIGGLLRVGPRSASSSRRLRADAMSTTKPGSEAAYALHRIYFSHIITDLLRASRETHDRLACQPVACSEQIPHPYLARIIYCAVFISLIADM